MTQQLAKSSFKSVWLIAIPMILSNITVPLLGIADTAVVGHLTHAYYIGAVAVGAMIFDFLYQGVNFLRMGTTGLTAQAYGRNDGNALRSTFAQAFIVAMVLALLLIVLQVPIKNVVVLLVHSAPKVMHYAGVYFSVRIWSAPATLGNFVILGWFIGLQNTRIPLMQVLIINSLGIVLDIFFVFGLHMDVAGVALASVIAQYIGLAYGLWKVRQQLMHYPGAWQLNVLMRLKHYRQFFVLNSNLFLRTISLIVVYAFFTLQGAQLGHIILAANAVLLNFVSFSSYALDGFANAAETLVGSAIGEHNRKKMFKAIYYSTISALIFALAFGLFYLLFGKLIIDGLTNIETVRVTAYQYLPWLMIMPIASIWCFLLDGIFVGATQSKAMRNAMLLSTFLIYLPCWYLLKPLGNNGLWLAFTIFMLARAVTLVIGFIKIDARGGFITRADKV